jgi:hypothetical protein
MCKQVVHARVTGEFDAAALHAGFEADVQHNQQTAPRVLLRAEHCDKLAVRRRLDEAADGEGGGKRPTNWREQLTAAAGRGFQDRQGGKNRAEDVLD